MSSPVTVTFGIKPHNRKPLEEWGLALPADHQDSSMGEAVLHRHHSEVKWVSIMMLAPLKSGHFGSRIHAPPLGDRELRMPSTNGRPSEA